MLSEKLAFETVR